MFLPTAAGRAAGGGGARGGRRGRRGRGQAPRTACRAEEAERPRRAGEGREEGLAAPPPLRRREAAMPVYEGLGSGAEKTAVVIDLGEAFTK